MNRRSRSYNGSYTNSEHNRNETENVDGDVTETERNPSSPSNAPISATLSPLSAASSSSSPNYSLKNQNGSSDVDANDGGSGSGRQNQQCGSNNIDISLNTILKSLVLTEFSLSFTNMIRYAIIALTVLMCLLYIFPQKLMILFLLLVLMVLIMVYIAVCRKVRTLQNKTVNPNKLKLLQNVYLRGGHNQANFKSNEN